MIFRFVLHFSALLRNTCSLLLIVSKFQLKSCFPHGGVGKKLFLRKMHFCEKWPFFAKNGQNFARFADFLKFFGFCINLIIIPTTPVIYSSIEPLLVKLWPKKLKKCLILDPKFPNKSQKRFNFNGPYLGNRRLFCDAVGSVETVTKSTFVLDRLTFLTLDPPPIA